MLKSFRSQSTLICIVLFCILFAYKQQSLVYAQTNTEDVQVDQHISGDSQVNVAAPLQLPDQPVTIKGSGEPGAKITMNVYSGDTILMSREVIVDAAGLWNITLPQFTESLPTRMTIRSEIPYTPTKIIETTTVTSAVAISSLVLVQLFVERGFRLFQLLGLLRKKKTKGFVYDTKTKKPVAFALLTIQNYFKEDNTIKPFKEVVVTTVDGFFQTVFLPPGKYTINAVHADYSFPTKLGKPSYASPFEFYQGEIIELIGQEQLEVFFIPMDPKDAAPLVRKQWLNFSVALKMLSAFGQFITIPMGIFSFIFLLIYPSFINFAIFSFYGIFLGYEIYRRWNTRSLKGKVSLKNGEAVPNAVIRVFNPKSNELLSVALSDKNGGFHLRLPKGQYRTIVSKAGLVSDESKEMSFNQIDLTKNQTRIIDSMSPAQTFVWSDIVPTR